jgi:hypothetical protein
MNVLLNVLLCNLPAVLFTSDDRTAIATNRPDTLRLRVPKSLFGGSHTHDITTSSNVRGGHRVVSTVAVP